MPFALPSPDHTSPKRQWAPWVDLDPADVTLTALVVDATDLASERILHVPTVQLKWAHCDPETNLWTQFSAPDRLIREVYDHITPRRSEVTAGITAFHETVQRISAIIDDPASQGYAPADLPVLWADRDALRSHLARLKAMDKYIEAHLMGGRVLRTEITGVIIDRCSAPPTFSFRTQPIEGMPFLNGMLRSVVKSRRTDPDDPDSPLQRSPNVQLVPYAPEDRVEVTRPIDRSFDLKSVYARNVARQLIWDHFTPPLEGEAHPYDLTVDIPVRRPYGWDWLVRGFLGLPRPAEPPPYDTPLVGPYFDPRTDDERQVQLWQAWFQGGLVYEPGNPNPTIFDGYPRDASGAAGGGLDGVASADEVLDWFDRLLAATLFASDDAPFKKIPFIFGPSNTGKSTLFNIVQQLIGSLYGHINNAALLNTRSMKDTAQLLGSVMGRRFITPSSEIPSNAQWRSEVVKAYVGNDQLLAERKYENPVEFRPQGGLWVAGNHYLSHEDRDDSMSNRLIYLTFHQPSGRRLSPGEVRSMIDVEAPDILTYLAYLHAKMRATYQETKDPSFWSDTAHAYPRGYEPDPDMIETETDPWSGLFEECFATVPLTDPHYHEILSNDDLYAVFRQWATRSEGILQTHVPTRSQFVSRVLKGRPGLQQARAGGSGPRGTRGLRLTEHGTSLLIEARTTNGPSPS